MKEIVTEFIIAGVSSFALTAILSRCIIPILIAKKAGQPIREEGPKNHMAKQGTPTMGGVAFIMAMALVMTGIAIWYAVLKKQNELIPLAMTMVLAVMNGMIGFFDDYKKLLKKHNEGLKAGQKFALQCLAAIIYIAALAILDWQGLCELNTSVRVPFLDKSVELGFVYYIFAVILIVGMVNSVNLTDGLDGLASSVTLIVAIFFSVVAFTLAGGYNSSLGILSICTVGAMLGFLIYNHHPAKVFMGDTGSLFLGGVISGMAFVINEPMIVLIAGGVFVFEAISVILQVFSFKVFHKRIFKCAPVHHHFEQCGWSEVTVVVVFSAATVLLCLLAYAGLTVRI